MAIDDNADYTLTGAQVKDLAARVKANEGDNYTAGNGIDIIFSPPGTPNVISIDDTVVAELSDIPTVNDATLTIQHNGTNVQTFTANQSTNATANIETIWADTIAPATAVAPITGDMIDFSSLYVTAPYATADISVPAGGAVIQSITLPAGKWRVFAQFRVAIGSMGANVTKFFYTGFKNGSTMSATSINQIPTNITSDSGGSGRVLVSMTSGEITSTGNYVIGSFVNFDNITATTQTIYKDPGIYLYALRVG